MEKRKLIWKFDEANNIIKVDDKSIKSENEKAFSFKLIRYKNSETYEESLRVESLLKGNENGYIDTSIDRLDKDLIKLKKYGVALRDIDYTSLKQKIEDVYLVLEYNEPDYDENAPKMVDSVVMKDILNMIGSVLDVFEYDKDKKHYILAAADFNKLIEESIYGEYDLKSIKEWLYKNVYTKCSVGRFTGLARIKGKVTRAMVFYADKIEKHVENTEEKAIEIK